VSEQEYASAWSAGVIGASSACDQRRTAQLRDERLGRFVVLVWNVYFRERADDAVARNIALPAPRRGATPLTRTNGAARWEFGTRWLAAAFDVS